MPAQLPDAQLAAAVGVRTGARVRIVQRDPRSAYFLKPLGHVGQTQFVAADIRDPHRMGDPNLALWLIVAVALFLLVGLAWFAIAALRWRAPPPPAAPRAPPEVALSDLASLRQQGYLQRNELQPFAFGLSSILRTYLGQRFAFPAPEWTTTEILRGLPPELRTARREQEIRQVLDATDLVKYAGRPVSPAELEQLADLCAELVTHTRPSGPDEGGKR